MSVIFIFIGIMLGLVICIFYPDFIVFKKMGIKILPESDYKILKLRDTERENTIKDLKSEITTYKTASEYANTQIERLNSQLIDQDKRIIHFQTQIEQYEKQHNLSLDSVKKDKIVIRKQQEAQKAHSEHSKPKPATPKPPLSKPIYQLEEDNLEKISGIGAVIQDKLNQEGIRSFKDLSELDEQKILILQQKTRILSSKFRQWKTEAHKILQQKTEDTKL